MIDPGTATLASAGLNAVGNAFSGGPDFRPSNLHGVNAGQGMLWDQMLRGVMGGQGDFGFGANYKKGKSQVQDFMAGSGVKMDPSNPAYAGMMGNMTGQAMGMDAQAKRDYTMNLLRTPLQVAQTQGANFLASSDSAGMDANRQYDSWRGRERTAYGDVRGWGK